MKVQVVQNLILLHILITDASISQFTVLKGIWGFSGGSVIKNPPTNAGDTGSIPDLGRSPHAIWSNQAHAKQLLSQHSNNQELQPLQPVGPASMLHKKTGHHKEKP